MSLLNKENKHQVKRNFDKTETLLAAVKLGVKEKPEDFFLIGLSCEDYWDPSWHKEFGVEENRTGGLQLTAEKTRAATAAPFHRFDGVNAVPLEYKGSLTFWLL
jgi:hypothetical protein